MAEHHKICAHCGAGFVTPNTRRIFCCTKCRNDAHHPPRKQRRAKPCAYCGCYFPALYTTALYCSSKCRSASAYAANPEKYRDRKRAYRSLHVEEARASCRKWRLANIEKQRIRENAKSKVQYAINPEKMSEARRRRENNALSNSSILYTMQLINQFKEESKHD